jgi:hypothetical protein
MEDHPMTSQQTFEIENGWKVFAGSEEVGEVVDVATDHLDVKRGTFRHHLYRIPKSYVAEATEGVVDLKLGRSHVDALEVTEHTS